MAKVWIGVHFANKRGRKSIRLWRGFHGKNFIEAMKKAYGYAKKNKWGTIQIIK